LWFEVGDDSAREKVSCFFRDKLHKRYRPASTKAKTARQSVAQRAQVKQNEAQTQQHGEHLVDGTGQTDDGTGQRDDGTGDLDLSSVTSSSSGSSKDSLGFGHSVEIDFFDINVF
jgi:hypothetical protein